MKTSFKRFAALALAAIMVLGTMNLGAWAAENGATGGTGNRVKDGALVISGLQEGDVVRFYKVLQETQDSWPENTTGWIYTSKFVTMSTTYAMPVSTLIGNPAANPAVPHQVTADAVGDIARLIAIENQSYKYIQVADSNGVATQPTPEPGMYVAIINPIDKDMVYNPVIVSCDYVGTNPSASWNVVDGSATYSNNAAAKKSTVTIEKSATTVEQTPDDVNPYTTAIGDSVSFLVETTVPGYGDVYVTPSFEMTDTLTGLKLKTGTVKVTDTTTNIVLTGDENVAIDTNDTTKQYKIVEKADGSGYTITFTYKFLKGLTQPHNIKVEYDAIVTTEAAGNINPENNTVDIKYTTNPTHSDEGKPETTPKSEDFSVKFDETNHYTFTIDSSALYTYQTYIGRSTAEFVKVGMNADGTTRIATSTWVSQITPDESEAGVLQGATFRLYRNEGCTEEYIPKNANGDPVAVAGSDALLYRTGADGRFSITGLDAGSYWLKEIDAPAGFIKRQTAVPIVIQTEIKHEPVTKWYFGGDWYPSKSEAETKAIAAGYKTAETDRETSKDGLLVKDVVKEYTATVDVLKWYKIFIDGSEAASHTFMHESNSSAIKWIESSAKENPSPIINTQGLELPSTGGIGTTIFYAGGAMLVLLAGILLVSKRRIA